LCGSRKADAALFIAFQRPFDSALTQAALQQFDEEVLRGISQVFGQRGRNFQHYFACHLYNSPARDGLPPSGGVLT
jgi:hypothetical protein